MRCALHLSCVPLSFFKLLAGSQLFWQGGQFFGRAVLNFWRADTQVLRTLCEGEIIIVFLCFGVGFFQLILMIVVVPIFFPL